MDQIDPSMPLDAGISRYVHVLRAGGVETFESCQGGAGHAMPEPVIRFHGDESAGFHAYAVAAQNGLPVLKFGRMYTMQGGVPSGPWWEMIFAKADEC